MTASQRIERFSGLAHDVGTMLIVTSVLFMILGLAAIMEPFVAGYTVTLVVGWLLVAAGITHIISIIRRDDGGAIWHIAVGLTYIVAGGYCVMHPIIALAALTFLLAIVLFVEAGVDIVAYSAQRHESGAIWLLVNAAVTALLGTLIAISWPSVSVLAIGAIVGINLLTTGFSRLMLGIATRRITA